MSDKSKIEWTDATWNPVRGCTKISAGCLHCYAETFAERWRGIKGHPFEFGFDLRQKVEERRGHELPCEVDGRRQEPMRGVSPLRAPVEMTQLFLARSALA